MPNLPNHSIESTLTRLFSHREIKKTPTHPPKVLILYGSLRKQSFSRLVALEAERILQAFGAETKMFDPQGLPVFDGDAEIDSNDPAYEKVKELRSLCAWSEAQVWSSPEIHGNMSGVFKNQIDWIPLKTGSIRPTQGKVLALCQVTGGSQSFNVVNNMRVLGRWMRMLTIPNQSSIAKAWQEFDEKGRLKDSPFRQRLVDVMEELFKFTLLTRGCADFLVERFSEGAAS